MNIAPVSQAGHTRPLASDIVATIARIALFHSLEEDDISKLMLAFDVERLRTQMVGLGICEADAGDGEVARLYFSGRCRVVSPNAFFDEAWYSQHYADVATALKSGGLVSGFVHFIKHGMANGLWPNSVLYSMARACAVPGPPKEFVDEAQYLDLNPAAGAFMDAFPSLTAAEHYNRYGRFLGYAVDLPPARAGESLSMRVAEAEFDADFYAKTYLSGPDGAAYRDNPFAHYVAIGMRAGHSPNDWFQEDWYRAFYKEVREAIAHGWLPSGFYHFLLSGRIEGRLPRFDLGAALEARMPGVTNPALLQRADMLKKRTLGLQTLPKRAADPGRARTIWIMLPTLNPDIMYGGYKSAIEMICALHRDGHAVAVLCLEESPNLPYFLWSEKSPRIQAVFGDIRIVDAVAFAEAEIGRSDLFIAYTVWDLKACAQLAALTDNTKPLLLAQEYEPIFYDNGAQRALCEACYHVPHYPIVNTTFLLSYLKANQLGIFRHGAAPRLSRDYAVFEHKINRLPVQSAASMRARRNRVLAVYARPEAHAARNLFEIVLIALQDLCSRGAFGPEWSFVGLGALTKMPPVALGGGHELKLCQKMTEDEYRRTMSDLDIGISLMYAPHPSVVPFEFATTGALVITNIYENRSAPDLRAICGNIIPCEPSLDSLVQAIEHAMTQVEKHGQRQRQALAPAALSWDDIFTPAFLSDIIASVSEDASTQPVSAVAGDATARPKRPNKLHDNGANPPPSLKARRVLADARPGA